MFLGPGAGPSPLQQPSDRPPSPPVPPEPLKQLQTQSSSPVATVQVGGNQDRPYNPVALENKSGAPSPQQEIQPQSSQQQQQQQPASTGTNSGKANLSMSGLLALSKALMSSLGVASASNTSSNANTATPPTQAGTALFIFSSISESSACLAKCL